MQRSPRGIWIESAQGRNNHCKMTTMRAQADSGIQEELKDF
jgi:hypothetical protein